MYAIELSDDGIWTLIYVILGLLLLAGGSSSACPVKSGELVQDYPCEQCDYEAEYGEDDEEGPHV